MTNYLTEKLPGTGGIIKESPEDFFVEEIPLYPACGEGEHLYVEVEKSGLTTFALLQRLSKALGVKEREIGYAGLKDAQATTRQTLSFTGVSAEKVESLQLEGIKILSTQRHRNKLRLGHLAGNHFTIRVRQVGDGALEKTLDILHVLKDLGVPNFFGEQRYGVLGNSHCVGVAILRGDFEEACRQIMGEPEVIENESWRKAAACFKTGDLDGALYALPQSFRNERTLVQSLRKGRSHKDAVMALPRKMLRLYLSACQSHLFDRLVTMRLAALDQLWEGDLAYKHANGASFLVTDPEAEHSRVQALEISPSAPLFGYKVKLAQGQTGLIENALLESGGLKLEDFRLGKGLSMEGERRPVRVPITNLSASQEGEILTVSFSLPKGSYATSVLREVMKGEVSK